MIHPRTVLRLHQWFSTKLFHIYLMHSGCWVEAHQRLRLTSCLPSPPPPSPALVVSFYIYKPEDGKTRIEKAEILIFNELPYVPLFSSTMFSEKLEISKKMHFFPI